jgi:hypothetical protein
MQAWSAQPVDGTILGVRLPASWGMSVHAGEQERLRSGKFSSVAKSMAFWAFYTGAIASASIASFSIVRGGRDAKPTIAEASSHTSRGAEAIMMPGSAADRSAAIAEGVKPKVQAGDAASLHTPKSSPLGEPDSGVPKLLQQGTAGGRETAPASRREAEAPLPSNAGRPHAIAQSTDPAAAGGLAAPVARSPSALPAETPPHSDTEPPRTGEKLQIAAKDKAKATAPTRNVSAASPSPAQPAKKHAASTPRRSAEAKRPVDRRPPAPLPRPLYEGQRAGSYYTDSTRGYGYGTYGPAPYSDTGD